GERDLLAAALLQIELELEALEGLEHLGELLGIVGFPVLLWRKANACAIGAATLVAAAERGRRGPGRTDEFGDREARGQHLGLERGRIRVVDQRMIDRRHWILPDQLFLRYFGSEIARARTEVPMRELEPGTCERLSESLRILEEPARDLLVFRVEP